EARTRLAAIEDRSRLATQRAALEGRVAEAQARLAQGDLAGAIERFDAVLRDDGSYAAAQRGLAEAQGQRTAREAQEKDAAARAAREARGAEGPGRVGRAGGGGGR